MNLIWSDFDPESEFSKMMREAKQVNGPEFWPTMRKVFEHDAATLPLPRFRLWASVHTIPLVTMGRTARFLGAAFDAAFKDDTIYNALVENWVGIPTGMENGLKVAEDFDTSMQRVQDMAHLCICGFTPRDLSGYNSILEIGGGYGDMCSVVHDLGFKGKYTILDFPEVQKIQEYYLKRNNIDCNFVTTPEQLETYDLVIGTWSLSEIPMDLRTPIMDKIISSKNWLIMYQAKIFGTISNDEYFPEKFKDRNAKFIIHNETAQDGKNTYMIVRQ